MEKIASKGWGDRLHDLFSINKKPMDNAVPDTQINSQTRRSGETYTQWGTRICGIVEGSLNALPPYLQKVYNAIYNEQAANVDLQKAARANTQAEIERKNEEIRVINERIESANSEIAETNKKIEDLKAERQEIISGKEKVNKEQRLKLVIGMIIIVPLTFYLFLFYSSTFYSAFHGNENDMADNLMSSMFDPHALSKAYEEGITAIGFVLSAPIIFMGLGFALHFFSVQGGKIKYLKMIAILLVTIIFDFILAIGLAAKQHKVAYMIGAVNEQTYDYFHFYKDINVWTVIFCGFIVYVIWGIVFDMCMSAYDKMDLNKTLLENIKAEIDNFEQRIKAEKDNIQDLKQQEKDAKDRVKDLMAKLGHEVYIDYAAIRTEMNNFFAGWIKMMQVLSLGQDLQDEATSICKREMSMLIPQK